MHEIASKMHKNRYQRWWSSRRAPILPIVRWGEDTVPQTSPAHPIGPYSAFILVPLALASAPAAPRSF